jgi:hypothetical protein
MIKAGAMAATNCQHNLPDLHVFIVIQIRMPWQRQVKVSIIQIQSRKHCYPVPKFPANERGFTAFANGLNGFIAILFR